MDKFKKWQKEIEKQRLSYCFSSIDKIKEKAVYKNNTRKFTFIINTTFS